MIDTDSLSPNIFEHAKEAWIHFMFKYLLKSKYATFTILSFMGVYV